MSKNMASEFFWGDGAPTQVKSYGAEAEKMTLANLYATYFKQNHLLC
jgi:hypothetical protein